MNWGEAVLEGDATVRLTGRQAWGTRGKGHYTMNELLTRQAHKLVYVLFQTTHYLGAKSFLLPLAEVLSLHCLILGTSTTFSIPMDYFNIYPLGQTSPK